MIAAKAAPNSAMFFGLRSRSSCPGAAVCSSTMLQQLVLFDDRDEARIAERQQRTSFQANQKCREPNSAYTDRRQQRCPMNAETFGMKGRRDKPENLNLVHERDAERHGAQRRGFALHRAR